MKAKPSAGFVLQTAVVIAAAAAVLAPVFFSDFPWPTAARDYLEATGVKDSGALNLVSAIYLGYRAFDTLGETIVLLVAVTGTIGLIAKAEVVPVLEEEKQPLIRTHLLETVTGKLGPVVLIFGLYVMLYGHRSPGGGFQGGVVIASGIVFLALGRRRKADTSLSRISILSRIEAAAFLFFMLASIIGIILGGRFFDNPLSRLAPSAFIIMLNSIIGVKVGAGMGLMCIAMLEKDQG